MVRQTLLYTCRVVRLLVLAAFSLLARGAVDAVLAPLAYGPQCWSTVELRNLGAGPARLLVEGHKGSGALVGLLGAASTTVRLRAGERLKLRLEVAGEESAEGWVLVRGDGVAVEGKTECVAGDRLTVAPQVVAFPVADPWLETEVRESRGRMAMVLNVSGEAATAKVCYSRGTVVGRPERGGEPERVCTETERLQIPPFGTRMVPLEREGNTRFYLQAKGKAVVLRVLVPMAGAERNFAVDSTVRFGEVVR